MIFIISINDVHLKIILFIILLICVASDIGGYIFGKIFKGPKLIKISPKKTYSGVIGGYLMSIIVYYLFINLYYGDEINSNDFVFILLISTINFGISFSIM